MNKYNIKDKVWTIGEGKIVEMYVANIKYDFVFKSVIYDLSYTLKLIQGIETAYADLGIKNREEKCLFKTKEELIKSL